MTMPVQKPHRSKQDYGTQDAFLMAVKRRLHIDEFTRDLAASEENRVCGFYFDEEMDSLNQEWNLEKGWLWCNPPYEDIKLWTRKAQVECALGANIAMLIPASVGSNWWRDYVDRSAHVLFINGRLTFKGHTAPYPKDCALLLYGGGLKGYEVWDWRKDA